MTKNASITVNATHRILFISHFDSGLNFHSCAIYIRHVAAPQLIWLCHCELSLKVIRDRDVFMAATFISMNRLVANDQLSSFLSLPASQRLIR